MYGNYKKIDSDRSRYKMVLISFWCILLSKLSLHCLIYIVTTTTLSKEYSSNFRFSKMFTLAITDQNCINRNPAMQIFYAFRKSFIFSILIKFNILLHLEVNRFLLDFRNCSITQADFMLFELKISLADRSSKRVGSNIQ